MSTSCGDWFDRVVYGTVPDLPVSLDVAGEPPRLTLTLCHDGRELPIGLKVHRPGGGPRPVVVVPNFDGNAATDAGGGRGGRFPVKVFDELGFAFVTFGKDDVRPDDEAVTDRGVHALLGVPETFGALAAWAWGMSRVLDWVRTRPDLFGPAFAAGHSRLGKAAILAAVRDERFAGVLANGSGCMGAALINANTGERPADVARFGHWFAEPFYDWVKSGKPPAFDQDALLGQVVPRPVAVTSAADDHWADPAAERCCVDRLRERHPDAPLMHHLRPGPHDLSADDWRPALAFFNNQVANAP